VYAVEQKSDDALVVGLFLGCLGGKSKLSNKNEQQNY
jgi:hypothetical protein